MIRLMQMFNIIIFIMFTTAVFTALSAEDMTFKAKQMQAKEKIDIVDDMKTALKCIRMIGGSDYVREDVLDYLRIKRDSLDEICGLDVLKGMYMRIESVNSGKAWEFGKDDNHKAEHSSWILIKSTETEKVMAENEFLLEEGRYIIEIQKVDRSFNLFGGLGVDAIKITLTSSSPIETENIDIGNKSKLKKIYDDIIKGKTTARKAYVIEVPAGDTVSIDDFVIPDNYVFRQFGKGAGTDRALWFEKETKSIIDMGLVDVKI